MSLKIHTFTEPSTANLKEWNETKPLILYLLGTVIADNEAFFTDIYLAIKGLSYFYDLTLLNGSGRLVLEKHLTVTAEKRDGYPSANYYETLINPLIVHLQLTDEIEKYHFCSDIEHLVDIIPYILNDNNEPKLAFYTIPPEDMARLTLRDWRLIVQERVMIGMHVVMDNYIKTLQDQSNPGPENKPGSTIPSRRRWFHRFIKS
jgi:hypothetical protein